jgi:hypothetical protein
VGGEGESGRTSKPKPESRVGEIGGVGDAGIILFVVEYS